ncbi:MAG: glycoside hydrolase family 5 protein [Candidatus Omnitrophica bacterium]|nr:glycoside hydrolase family 5 protein [Candidatus Omnitrophota bacterium]
MRKDSPLFCAAFQFKKNFASTLGPKALKDFEKSFYGAFIQESDFQNIAKLGFNCIRLPFHHGLVETKPYQYSEEGLRYLDQALQWAKKYKLYVILDLHAAVGCQNHDWHSDSLGKAELWQNKTFQDRTFALWEFLADRYKDHATVAGYDLLNEAVIDNTTKLNDFYQELIRRIRLVDKNHIFFVEGNKWATDIECLDHFKDDNFALSIHFYSPLEFTFNFVPLLSYPLRCRKPVWDKAMLGRMVDSYGKIAKRRQLPIFVGEFGVNDRDNRFGEGEWLSDALEAFKQHGFHWTYWTYKAVKNTIFPDGLLSYYPNDPWVNRHGPQLGWDTYAKLWGGRKKEIIESWKTKNYTPSTKIIKVLQR